jgi:methyl-accepting chemotaxis protein
MSADPGYDNRTRRWFVKAKAARCRIAFTDSYVDMITNELVVTLSKTMFDKQGREMGAVGEDIFRNMLEDMANGESAIPEIISYILHPTGRYISNRDASVIMEKDFLRNMGWNSTGPVSCLPVLFSEPAAFICSEPLPMANWNPAPIIPAVAVFGDVHRIMGALLIVALAFLALISAGLYFFIRDMFSPIKIVSRKLRNISEGEEDLTKSITVKANNEIGDLAQYFNLMLQKI